MQHKKRTQISTLSEYIIAQNRPLLPTCQNNSSPLESPIRSQSNQHSDHSSEPFLYPSSLQPRQRSAIKCLNLKTEVIRLLAQLKEWLLQLCLTESNSNEIYEQLQPIIDQIIDLGEDYNENSGWMQNSRTFENQKKTVNSLLIRQISKNRVSSMDFDKHHQNRQQSTLIHQSRQRPFVALFNQNEKRLVKLYFKRYYRLLQNCLAKINKCSGQKKLKFLVQTTLRNIFRQTMRVSYDLKIVEHRLKEERQKRYSMNRMSNTILIKQRVELIFQDRGSIRTCFHILKRLFYNGIKRDQKLVGQMFSKIGKICNIYQRNKRSVLNRYTFVWRQSVFRLKNEEELLLVDSLRLNIEQMLSHMLNLGQCKQQFSVNWRSVIETHINILCEQLFSGQECIFISLQQILKQRYPKKQKQISIIQYLEEYQLSSITYRTDLNRDYPFLNEFTLQELKNCIISGQIYRSDKMSNNLLLVPIKSAPGIVFVKLYNQKEPRTNSFAKQPMTLQSFRSLLRVVQLMAPILQDFVNVCKRIQKNWEQVEKNNHYELLFKEYLKIDLPKDIDSKLQGHLQFENGCSQIEINSNRLQSPSSIIGIFMDRYNITNLMIYHCEQGNINEMPCIIYGDKEMARSQKYIIKSIFAELVNSGKEFLVIVRNSKSFNILPIRNNMQYVGMIYYTNNSEQKIDNNILAEYVIPLVLKYEGSISCPQCKVLLKLPKQENIIEIQNKQNVKQLTLEFQDMIRLVTCRSLHEIQRFSVSIVKKMGNFFHKMIYKLDVNDRLNFFSIESDNKIEYFSLKEKEMITHKQTFIQQYEHLSNCSTFTQIALKNPCFLNSQLHIYQHENSYQFRMIAIPIKLQNFTVGYFLVGYYLTENTKEEIIEYFKYIVNQLSINKQIFKFLDLENNQLQNYCKNTISNNLNYQNWVGKGKLANQISDFSELIISDLNSKYHLRNLGITAFKMDKDTQLLKPIYSSMVLKQLLPTLSSPFNNIEFNQSIITTHQKLYSHQFQIKKNSFNRTIRPLRSRNLSKIIFYPAVDEPCKSNLMEKIKSKFELEGWVANEHWNAINQLSKCIHTEVSENNMYYLMNIGSNMGKQYLILIQHQLLQPQQKNHLENTLHILQQSYSKILTKSFLFASNTQEKANAIDKLSIMLKNGYTKQKIIKKFELNQIVKQTRVTSIYSILSKYVQDANCKNIRYFKLIGQSFLVLTKYDLFLKSKHSNFIQKITPIIQVFSGRQLKKISFHSIYHSIQQPFSLNCIRSSKKMFHVLKIVTQRMYRYQFTVLKKVGEQRLSNKKFNKSISIHKMYKIAEIIIRRQALSIFFNRVQKFYKEFSTNFDLIAQQYMNSKFNSRQSFLKFSNERFNMIINHQKFGLVSSIEIQVGQIYQNQLIIYRLAEGKMEQIIAERPNISSLQKYNNYNFVQVYHQNHCHYLLYKCTYKVVAKNQKQQKIINKAIQQGSVPAYLSYLQKKIEITEKMCSILLNITCKEMWNTSTEGPKKIIAFGKGNYEVQCDKLRVVSRLKSLKCKQDIQQLKITRSAINEQTKTYYNLQYQHNAVSNVLTSGIGNLSKQQSQVVSKYGQLITKQRLKRVREETEILENKEQNKLLQYQIKSKTFATSKIITYCEKKENQLIEQLSLRYLANKENQPFENQLSLEKVYVQRRLELVKIKDKIIKEKQKIQTTAARALWVTLSKLKRSILQYNKKTLFEIILLPKKPSNNYRF